MGKKYKDIEIGDKFVRLEVVKVGKYYKYHQYWWCKCSCGNEKLIEINESDLNSGHSQSCGCLKIENTKIKNSEIRSKTFFDWCLENKKEDVLDLWDYKLNDKTPKEINYSSNKKYYFKCPNGLHSSELYIVGNITHKNLLITCRKCNSFGQWCINNDRMLLLSRWDCKLNNMSPFDISYGSKRCAYFKCPKGLHESEKTSISDITNFKNTAGCNKCNSFVQWGIDNVSDDFIYKYWSDKNIVSGYDLSKNSLTKIWIKCQEKDYHADYEISCANFIKGKRCSYCAGKMVDYYDSLGYLYPQVIEMWSNKNINTPYDYLPDSNKYVLWKCSDDIHDDYERTITCAKKLEFRCPNCVRVRGESFLQEKVRLYLSDVLKYNIRHEYNCSIVPVNPKNNYKLPFDNEVIALRLIIEVHGLQHYTWENIWFKGSEEQRISEFKKRKLYDRYKKAVAECNGYFYLEIPYWTEKDESYKSLIDNKISEILKQQNIAS